MIPIRRFRAAATLLACMFGVARPSHAQSTGSLGSYTRDVLYQISVGGDAVHGWGSGPREGPLVAMDVSAHVRTQSAMRLRVDAWVFDGGAADSNTYYIGRVVKSRTVAATVSGEFPVRLSRTITVGAILGVGYAPYSRVVVRYPSPTNEPSIEATSSGTGAVFSVGVALRWRGLVVEQFVHQSSAIPYPLNEINSPLMIGWRF